MIISEYFLLFIIYSIIGYIIEIVNCYVKQKKFVNRGFLIGTWYPVYGVGALIVTTYLNNYLNDFLVVFVMSMFFTTIIEYLFSYVLEKIFNLRWWDYSKRKYNINGRVCLKNMVIFGIFSSIAIYIVNPIITCGMFMLPYNILNNVSYIIFILFIIDNIISISIINNLDIEKNTKEDMTEIISIKVKKKIINSVINLFNKEK